MILHHFRHIQRSALISAILLHDGEYLNSVSIVAVAGLGDITVSALYFIVERP